MYNSDYIMPTNVVRLCPKIAPTILKICSMSGSTYYSPTYLAQAYHSLKVQGLTKDIMSLVEVATCMSNIYTWFIYSRWTSLVPRPRGRREKLPGMHCLRMRERFRKFRELVRLWTSYTWLLCGEITKLDIRLVVWQLC